MNTAAQPRVSVIVPMRNEAARIGACLDSILQNDFPSVEVEILVVDGDSSDGSADVVRERMRISPNIRLLHNSKREVPSGLNLAIRQAQGQYILRMDAHCEYPPDYISNCVTELERTGAANVGGSLRTLPGADTWVAKSIALLTQHPIGVGNSAFRLGKGDAFVDTVPFGAFRREIFDEVGVFREDLVRNQDYEFNARIRSFGHKIYLSSRISNVYFNSPTFSRFIRQAISNGLWGARCWVRYPESFCLRHAAPFGFFASLTLLVILGLRYKEALFLAMAVACGYVLALVVAAVQIAWKHSLRHLFLVPGLIASYHLSYAAATAWGFFDVVLISRWLWQSRDPETRETALR